MTLGFLGGENHVSGHGSTHGGGHRQVVKHTMVAVKQSWWCSGELVQWGGRAVP